MMYGLNDVCLIPAVVSEIEHRSQCNPYNIDNMLPLFTAPMNAVINEDNYQLFLKNKINTVIPRGVSYEKRWELSTKTFVAVGLDEFKCFIQDFNKIFDETEDVRYVCVDIANGHMKKLIDLCAKAKDMFGGRLILMTGNIANPYTYLEYAKAGIDFIRLCVGSGSACLTSCNVAIHSGLASLIIETAKIKKEVEKHINFSNCYTINPIYKSTPFIIADGGFDNYDKIIKALALGADYVMIGKLFAQSEEACEEKKCVQSNSLEEGIAKYSNISKKLKWIYNEDLNIWKAYYRSYYGMSTKRAQKETGNKILKTSEGIEFFVPVLYTLEGWCDNFISYLRSAMSYTNSLNLSEFKNAEYKIVSPSEYVSFYK